ncbi:MAG TPA: MarR family transcriptional regulator [Leptospiraceae bacterium]|nr:MarR family transcriptional regulator [Leptospiraceae bacterium]HMW04902.1 MarR family transcriptional regulator [Leptospiraceae bacterium]HMX34424.1 MarR family transcriptional regulator [Leptospiraceae bacterium]HMY30877.1 MarR family transcriptional regulator [Leptospiraceae bacterium]HMZ62681.1 MarR family transcriptional regulator [Leptospiraceae bacterium]
MDKEQKKEQRILEVESWRSFLSFHADVMFQIEKEMSLAGLIPLAWYDVLIVLEQSREKKRTLGELSKKCLLTKSGISKIMNTLEKEKLVTRYKNQDDGRSYYAEITEKGSNLVKKAWVKYKECIYKYFIDNLSKEEQTNLRIIFQRLKENLSKETSFT